MQWINLSQYAVLLWLFNDNFSARIVTDNRIYFRKILKEVVVHSVDSHKINIFKNNFVQNDNFYWTSCLIFCFSEGIYIFGPSIIMPGGGGKCGCHNICNNWQILMKVYVNILPF
jgi:hypothetical protein